MAIGTFTGFDGAGSGEDLEVFAPHIWSSKVNMYYGSRLVAAKHFTDMSEDAAGGAIQINIPNFSEGSATAKTNGNVVTLQTPKETDTNLVIDTWEESSYFIEKKELKQVASSYNLQNRYAEAAGFACAKSLDAAILALFSGFDNGAGSSTATLADSDIRGAIQKLSSLDVPLEETAFFFHPNEIWGDLLAIDKYVSFDYSDTRPIDGGGLARMAGKLYGIPVFETSNVQVASGSRLGGLAHKDALVWAVRGGVEIASNYIPMYMGQLITADILYGVLENRGTSGYYLKSSS